MVGTLEANGDNTAPLKHMGKAKLSRAGDLPVSISVERNLIRNSRLFLEHHRHILVKATRIKAAKKKAVEDEIDLKRFKAHLLKEERTMEAAARKAAARVEMDERRFEAALTKEEKIMEAEAKKKMKMEAVIVKKEAAKAKKVAAAKAKKEATAVAKAKKSDEQANKRLVIAEERHAKKSRVDITTDTNN